MNMTKITSNGIMTNKNLWKTMRFFSENKGIISENGISLFEVEKPVIHAFKVEEIIYTSYTNVVKKYSGIKPKEK